MLSGQFAGIAGVVMLSRANSGRATESKGFEFDMLTAAALGGLDDLKKTLFGSKTL